MNKGAAFVVGGTGGLGSAICRRLSTEWDNIAIGYRSSREKALAVAASLQNGIGQALPVSCDLSNRDSIEAGIRATVDRFGTIGTMIFASGVEIPQPFVSKISEEQWREVIEIELIGFTRIVSATLPHFRTQGFGNFVAVVSVANYCFPPGDALSSVPKAGMEALGRAVAKEEGRYGIRANMVAPGIIDAGLGADFLKSLYSPEIWETQRKRIALQCFGSGEDIAESVAFLASDKAKYVTGQTLIVDGGFSL
ncbi:MULTISPECIES: SDR family NAD(P)-dependent oxidoreductase [Sphingobium]|jgi:NAD(P)-dependent dehydrogenase (short-subunit alcohol dehydrogenase family)|uniref:Short-chain dehydrogenase n=1 Tax=Sphingobium baderi TaxID=1332080 RepID=A0A0S3F2A0_9SPHN|nr:MULTISPECIES: SDR family oxidoreductase [Sphingobium]ALR21840.1 short-chain dehydrogenase [Sphingobium baderi]